MWELCRIFTNTSTLVAETKGPHIFARCVQKKCRQWEGLALGLVSEFVPALQRHYTSSIPHWFSKDVNIPLTLLLSGTRQHDVSKITQKHNGTYVSPFSTTSYDIKASLQICGWLLRRVGFSWFWTVQLVRFTCNFTNPCLCRVGHTNDWEPVFFQSTQKHALESSRKYRQVVQSHIWALSNQ